MRSRWKRFSHSLLTTLLAATTVVCAIVSILIFWIAEQSVNKL